MSTSKVTASALEKNKPHWQFLSRPSAVKNMFTLLIKHVEIIDANLINQTNMIKLINMPTFIELER